MENRAFFHVYLCLVCLALSFGSHLPLFCCVLKFKLSAGIHINLLAVLSLEKLLQGEIKAQRETFPLYIELMIASGQQSPEMLFFHYVPFSRGL